MPESDVGRQDKDEIPLLAMQNSINAVVVILNTRSLNEPGEEQCYHETTCVSIMDPSKIK